MSIVINKTGDLKSKNPVIVVGLPGTGLVGSVSAAHMVENLGMTFIGHISSPEFAPLASIHNYNPMPAVRIHYSEKYNVVVVLSEMSIPVASSQELAEKLFEFSKSLKASYIVSVGGISMKEDENAVYIISTDKKISKTLIGKSGIKPIREGATTGVTGVLLTKGSLENYPVVSILAESSPDYLDPKAASNVLKALSSLLNVKIDTGKLDEEASELTKTMKDNLIKGKLISKKMSKDPTGSMYG